MKLMNHHYMKNLTNWENYMSSIEILIWQQKRAFILKLIETKTFHNMLISNPFFLSEFKFLIHSISRSVSYPYLLFILLSLTHVMVEKVLFLGQIFEMHILVDLQVIRTPESENHFFSVWSVCVCMCVRVSMCLLSS